jgi:monoamine oxidase
MQQSPGTKVIIIGAGISGLVAALRLQQAGVVVLVLEKEPQVGGRVYSESLGGVPVNLGAQYFFKSDNKYLNRYVRKAKTFSPDSGLHGALWDGVPFYSRDDSFYADIPVDARALNDFDLSIKKMQKTVKSTGVLTLRAGMTSMQLRRMSICPNFTRIWPSCSICF